MYTVSHDLNCNTLGNVLGRSKLSYEYNFILHILSYEYNYIYPKLDHYQVRNLIFYD